MAKKDKIIDAANKLENSAIFNMSLSSKELFHSNFWAWMMRNETYGFEVAKIFFKDLKKKDYDCTKIEREKGNMDISFIDKQNNLYIIENKLKSYPNKKQLEKYEKKSNDAFKKGIITGVIKPEFVDELITWDFISYKEISSKISKKILPIAKGSDKVIIKEYCEMLNDLYDLIDGFYYGLSDNRLPIFKTRNNNVQAIKKINLYDLCQKYIAYKFLEDFKNKKEYKQLKEYETSGWKLHTNPSYHHGKYTIDIVWLKNEGKMNEISVGIQIEGKEYRRIAEHIFKNKNDEAHNNEVFNNYLDKGWFVEYNKKNKSLFKKDKEGIFVGTSMSKMFCKYNSSTKRDGGVGYYSHIRQYWNINPDNSDFDLLYKEIKKDLLKARKIIA